MRTLLLIRLLRESFLFALNAIVVNKLRTILSLLGITIGIFAIISVFTIFDSMENYVRKNIESIGDNVLFIRKWPQFEFRSDYPWWEYWKRPVPTIAEMEEIQKRSIGMSCAVFTVGTSDQVEYNDKSVENASFTGVSQDFNQVLSFQLSSGRYFTPIESQSGRNVAVIGYEIAQSLFGSNDPIGRQIKVRGRKLEVIGVFAKEGEDNLGSNYDNQVMTPVNFIRNIIDIENDDVGPTIIVKAKPLVANDELKDELTGIMRSVRKLKPSVKDNFTIEEITLLAKSFESIFSMFALAGWVIGGFALLVGGFGIANIMFVSVRERTKIIGIQKSLGAKKYFILFQFLFEAIFLCLIGGLVGLLLVFLGALLGSQVMDMKLMLSAGNIRLAMIVSTCIGLISGFIPAWIASRLNPVEAIRTNA